jgi:mono/diheme cytochrome c family protein
MLRRLVPSRMPHRTPRRTGLLSLSLISTIALPSCADRAQPLPTAPPVVAGLAQSGLDVRGRGLVLLDELGCTACHANDPPTTSTLPRGPELATVGNRVRPDYLVDFLTHPGGVEPGTPMPDLLHGLGDTARKNVATNLSHYLRSFAAPAAPSAADATIDAAAAATGRALYHEIGCVACHAPRDADGGELALPNSVPMAPLARKYTHAALYEFLLAPHTARPSRRMPDLRLAPAEAHALTHFLLSAKAPVASATTNAADHRPDAERIAAGRAEFAARGCAHCHALADPLRAAAPSPKPLATLDPTRGCLGEAAGSWPRYALTAEQRTDLAAALRDHAAPRTDEQRLQQMLVSNHCTACHQRDGLAGIADDRQRFFTSRDASLGEDGRLPPTLTLVGAKLQRGWLRDAIAHGQMARPYLRTRMPAFGPDLAERLTGLLANTDTLPPVAIAPLPEDDKQRRAVTDLGRTLVGDKGMNCITCHTFAGDQVGTMGAIDLVDSTGQRLRPEWFAHFLREPFRFRPGTLMPRFFVDGTSVRPELADGDAARQIDAMWHYLAEGRNVGKPSGMRHPPIELVVDREAVLLRRSAQHTGKRAISVGLPHAVNLTFDAERLAMNQIWWGRFVDAAPVWTSQGSGQVHLLGKPRHALPNGPAFAILAGRDDAWPAADRRELGHRFLGYDLDAMQRPTFRYTCGPVEIADAPIEQPVELPAGAGAEARSRLRRTWTFRSDQATTLQFRAALDARIDDLGDGLVQVGASLRLRLPPASFRILPAGEQRELRVEIVVPPTGATLSIDYTSDEVGK